MPKHRHDSGNLFVVILEYRFLLNVSKTTCMKQELSTGQNLIMQPFKTYHGFPNSIIQINNIHCCFSILVYNLPIIILLLFSVLL